MMGFYSSTGQLHIPLKRNEMKQTHLIKRGKKQPNIALKEKKESYIGAMIVNSVMYHPPKTKLSFVRLRQSYIRRPKAQILSICINLPTIQLIYINSRLAFIYNSLFVILHIFFNNIIIYGCLFLKQSVGWE